jgi:transcriptional regulator with XRE-family HTH domain
MTSIVLDVRRPRKWDPAVGGQIRRLRLYRGLSRVKLAQEAGITAQKLKRLELGQQKIHLGDLASILRVLDLALTFGPQREEDGGREEPS